MDIKKLLSIVDGNGAQQKAVITESISAPTVSKTEQYFKAVNNEVLQNIKEQQAQKTIEVKRVVSRVLEKLEEGKTTKDKPAVRNFVAKNAPKAGAGAHKDKKKAEKQGDIKHKKELVPMDEERTEVRDKDGNVTSWKDEGEWKKSTAKKDGRGKVTNLSDKARRETEKLSKKEKEMAESSVDLNPGEDPHYFRVRHQTKRDIELEMPPRAWDGVGPAYATYEEAKTAFETLKSKHPNEKFTVTQHSRISHMGGVAKRVFPEEVSMEARDPEDWDEGNTEPPNNFAVYINGKKWKVIKGRGQFADDYKERDHLRQLNAMAQQKSLATGKKWTISVTGEPATESIAEKAPPGFKGTVKAMKKHKDIDNPFALAWSMKNKGYKSHKKADGSDK
jgi:hypothetical protein